MAVVIRLARFGAKHQARYRITVADHRRSVKGKYLEVLGYYHPHEEKKIEMDLVKAQDWIKKGAQPSERVKHVMKLAEKSK
jgi:small subunit ribosomal protein S16